MNKMYILELVESILLSIMIICSVTINNVVPVYRNNSIGYEFRWKKDPTVDVYISTWILVWIYTLLFVVFTLINMKFNSITNFIYYFNKIPIFGFSLQWFTFVIALSGICVSIDNKRNFLINKQDIFQYKKVHSKVVLMLTLFIFLCIIHCLLINNEPIKDTIYKKLSENISFFKLINIKIIVSEYYLLTFILHFCFGIIITLNVLEICFYDNKNLEYRLVCNLSKIKNGYVRAEDINYNGVFSINYIHLMRDVIKFSNKKKVKSFIVINSYDELLRIDKKYKSKIATSLIIQRNINSVILIVMINILFGFEKFYGARVFQITSIVISLLLITLYVLLLLNIDISLLKKYIDSYISKYPILISDRFNIISDLPLSNKKDYNSIVSVIIYSRAISIYFCEKYGESEMFNKWKDLLSKLDLAIDYNKDLSADLIISAIELYTLYHIARANCDKHSEKSDKKIYYNICKEMSPGKDCNQMMLQLLKLNAYHFDFQIYKNIIS